MVISLVPWFLSWFFSFRVWLCLPALYGRKTEGFGCRKHKENERLWRTIGGRKCGVDKRRKWEPYGKQCIMQGQESSEQRILCNDIISEPTEMTCVTVSANTKLWWSPYRKMFILPVSSYKHWVMVWKKMTAWKLCHWMMRCEIMIFSNSKAKLQLKIECRWKGFICKCCCNSAYLVIKIEMCG